MAFPFWWVGAAVAALFLAGAFTLFALAMRALVWTADEVRESMLPGIVSGFRGWTGEGTRPARVVPPPAAGTSEPQVEELGSDAALRTVRARRR
jgi:hypothetical protein